MANAGWAFATEFLNLLMRRGGGTAQGGSPGGGTRHRLGEWGRVTEDACSNSSIGLHAPSCRGLGESYFGVRLTGDTYEIRTALREKARAASEPLSFAMLLAMRRGFIKGQPLSGFGIALVGVTVHIGESLPLASMTLKPASTRDYQAFRASVSGIQPCVVGT